MRQGADRSSQRGFALLLVLVSLAGLSLVTARLISDGRGALAVARALRDAGQAEAAADGAVQQAVFQLRRGTWAADGHLHAAWIGRATVSITMIDERGRINPNRSGLSLLSALMIETGAQPAPASKLAGAIVDWRTATPFSVSGGLKLDLYRNAGLPYGPPGRPFESVDELAQVPGMTTQLLVRLRPYLSVYQSGAPVVGADADAIRAALQTAAMIGRAPAADFGTADRVVEIHAIARLPEGARFERRATARLGTTSGTSKTWQILDWGE